MKRFINFLSIFLLPAQTVLNGACGCDFCAEQGTGFEALNPQLSVTEQLTLTREKIEKKYHAHKFIAYFQNYTNTFLPIDRFEKYMREGASFPDVVEISISTRPDCIRSDYLEILEKIRSEFQVEITLELGLQTVNYHTLRNIHRGHTLAEFIDAMWMSEIITLTPVHMLFSTCQVMI